MHTRRNPTRNEHGWIDFFSAILPVTLKSGKARNEVYEQGNDILRSAYQYSGYPDSPSSIDWFPRSIKEHVQKIIAAIEELGINSDPFLAEYFQRLLPVLTNDAKSNLAISCSVIGVEDTAELLNVYSKIDNETLMLLRKKKYNKALALLAANVRYTDDPELPDIENAIGAASASIEAEEAFAKDVGALDMHRLYLRV